MFLLSHFFSGRSERQRLRTEPAWKGLTHFLECWTCSPQGRHRLDHLGQQRAHTSPACSGASIVFLTLLWQQARRDISDHISTGIYLLRCFCSNYVLLFDCSLYNDNKQGDKYKNIFRQAKLKILQKKKGGEGGEEMVKVKAEVTNKHSFVHTVSSVQKLFVIAQTWFNKFKTGGSGPWHDARISGKVDLISDYGFINLLFKTI